MKIRIQPLVICGLFLIFSTAASAQTGTITGTVTDAVSATPILSPANIQVHRADGSLLSTASTNASGQYTFTGLTPGVYFVKIGTAITYYNQLFDNIPCVADDCRITSGTPVTVTAGGTAVADFALEHDRMFFGTVRLASNNAVVTMGTVQVFNASGAFVMTANTGLDGRYVAYGLTPGIYFARATINPPAQRQGLSELYGGILCPDSPNTNDPAFFKRVDPSCRILAGTPISTVSANPINIDFSLDPPATIGGRVVADAGGSPIGGITVALFSGDVEIARTQTVSDGFYVLSGVYPGTYRVRTIGTGPYVDEWLGNVCVGCSGVPQALTVGVGANVTGIDFSLATGGAITGSVTCPGSVFVLGPTVSAFNASGQFVRAVDTFCPTPPTPAIYRVDGLAPGTYYLRARDPLVTAFGIRPWGGSLVDKLFGDVVCNTVDCDVRRGVPVTVTLNVTTGGIDFVMEKGADSSVAGSFRTLRMFDSRGVEMAGVVRAFLSFGLFGFQAVGLPPGTYFAKWGNTLHGGITCVDCPPTSGLPIVIRPGDTAFTLDFGPPTGGRSISGNVSDDGPQPLSMIGVELLGDSGTLLASTFSDQSGNYQLADVQPGTYFLRTRNDRGYADEVYQNVDCAGCDPRQGTPIVVASADVANINFTLALGGVIGGATRDTSQNVVGNVPVSIFSSTGTLVGQTVSLPSGTFRVNVPAGSYRARAEATPAHGAELFSELPCTSGSCDVTTGTAIAVTTGIVTPNINFTLASCSAMTLSPTLLATGVVGTAYRQVMTVSGGTSPNQFRVTNGGLPGGIALDGTTGVLSGTPTLSGRYEFNVGAVDANGCATARAMTIDVQECAFVLRPGSATLPVAGGAVTVAIDGACGPQTVTNATGFVHEQSNTPGEVVLLVDANTGTAPRFQDITIGRRVFTVRQAGTGSMPPFGAFDAPLDGSQVAGSLALGGWALDDLEVLRVVIFRDPVGGEGISQIFLGNAVFVRGARPDVAHAYPTYQFNDRAGWGFLVLTNMLPNQGNGAFRLHAYAVDAEGQATLLGSKTIVGTNASATDPFGTIDTPSQGSIVSGRLFPNFGWALTPQPKIIPTDGSTIHVMVDGATIGHPLYNLFRPDVAALFPGLANSGGPVGLYTLDTTALEEGQHTIAWIVYDNLGAGTGIGSRYFTVANSADAGPTASAGVEGGRRIESLASAAAADEPRTLALRPLERLELPLEPSSEGCAATWAGYLVDKKRLEKLPVGSSIDPTGTFYWQPGPGFKGTFDLVFVRTGCDGTKSQLPVAVTIER
jgi:hypothetical protein